MKIESLDITDVKYITPTIFGDHRGYFFESFHAEKFAEFGIDDEFCQDNQSKSTRGTLRGLHLQLPPKSQAKLVRVISGDIFDVAVDIRVESPTFGKWVAKTLSHNRHDMLYIPKGFAHGFYTLSETAEVMYKCSDFYAPEYERSLCWSDPDIGIDWPIDRTIQIQISKKDQDAIPLTALYAELKKVI